MTSCGPTPSSETLITTLTINGLEGVATIDETKAVFYFDKLDSATVSTFDLSVSPGAAVTHADGTALTAENLVLGEEFPVLVTAEDGITTQTYTLLITGDIVITNKHSNGYYVWFDVILHQDAVVDFYAVEEGTTLPSAASVAAMDDTDGDQAVDGHHFQDALVAGETHRIVLYNMDTSTNYDIGSYFSGGKYPNSHAAVLTQMTTAAEPRTTGKVVWPAYEGQKILLPPARLKSTDDIPDGSGLSYNLEGQASWASILEILDGSYQIGWNYDFVLHAMFSMIFDSTTYLFTKIDGVLKAHTAFYFLSFSDQDIGTPEDYIDLQVRN